MTTRRLATILALLATVSLLAGCNKEIESAEDVLSGVELTQVPGNVLRFNVDLKFKQDCSFNVEYWESANPQAKSHTRTFESKDCKGHAVIMFVKSHTDYMFKVNVSCAGKTFPTRQDFDFKTKDLPMGVPQYEVSSSYPQQDIPGYILHGQASSPTGYLTFTDTDGTVVWYQDFDEAVRHFHYDPESRAFVVLTGFKNSLSDVKYQRFCNKFVRIDLQGNILEEWKAADTDIKYPHHDVKILPDRNLMILHSVAKPYDLSSLGMSNPTDVYGDGFTVFAQDGSKLFSWDTSCELDPLKDTYLNVRDSYYDLVHANSVSEDSDGNYYITLNNLDELWKIDGKTGKVLYRVGEHGDIKAPENGSTSGIHSSVPLGPDNILVLDNGSKSKVSRALVYRIDPAAKTAAVELSVAIPSELSSTDRSNCEILDDMGMIFFGSTAGKCCLFTDMEGNVLKVIKRTGISYRTHYFKNIDY